jgi:hypothetical protein
LGEKHFKSFERDINEITERFQWTKKSMSFHTQ